MPVARPSYACPDCDAKLIEDWDDPAGHRFYFLWCETCVRVIDMRFPDESYTFHEQPAVPDGKRRRGKRGTR